MSNIIIETISGMEAQATKTSHLVNYTEKYANKIVILQLSKVS